MPRQGRVIHACGRQFFLAQLLACAGVTLAQSAQTGVSNATEVFRIAAPSVVVVKAQRSGGRIAQGSGVVFHREPMSDDRWVATNCHVALGTGGTTVEFVGTVYPAKLLVADTDLDLCLLIVNGLPAPSAKIRAAPALSIGEPVYAIGAPRGLEHSLSAGIISQFREHPSTYRFIQSTVPISPGSSGGGLFDAEGRLIGIMTFFLRESQNLNFALPATAIDDLAFASVWIGIAALLSEKPDSRFAIALDEAMPGWRQDLNSPSFSRWLGLARDAKGRRRRGGIDGFSLIALPPDSWQPAIELFRDYRASSFYRAEQHAERPRAQSPRPAWQRIGRSGDLIIYGDPSRIRKHGGQLIAWTLIDFAVEKEIGTKRYRSMVIAHEIECETGRIATRQATFFSEQMGSGEMSSSYNPKTEHSQFDYALPGSTWESVVTWACEAR